VRISSIDLDTGLRQELGDGVAASCEALVIQARLGGPRGLFEALHRPPKGRPHQLAGCVEQQVLQRVRLVALIDGEPRLVLLVRVELIPLPLEAPSSTAVFSPASAIRTA